MIVGSIHHPNTYKHILTHPAWRVALAWIQKNTDLEDGDYEIEGRDIYASIKTIATMPREQGVFEAHRAYVDVHYCITGSECIEWAPVDDLSPREDFHTEEDYGLYEPTPTTSSIILTPGKFACFFPADAHMPKIMHGTDTHTKKGVIKIKETLVL